MASNLDYFVLKLTHTGKDASGNPNLQPVLIPDLDVGYEYQSRKVPVYVPVGGSIELPYTSRSMLSVAQGAVKKFVESGYITAQAKIRFSNTIIWAPYGNDFPGSNVPEGCTFYTEWADVVSAVQACSGPTTIQIYFNQSLYYVEIPGGTWNLNQTTIVGPPVQYPHQGMNDVPYYPMASTSGGMFTPGRLIVATEGDSSNPCILNGVVGLKDLIWYSNEDVSTFVFSDSVSLDTTFTLDNVEFHGNSDPWGEFGSLLIQDNANVSVQLKNNSSTRWRSIRISGDVDYLGGYALVETDTTGNTIAYNSFRGTGVWAYAEFMMRGDSWIHPYQFSDGAAGYWTSYSNYKFTVPDPFYDTQEVITGSSDYLDIGIYSHALATSGATSAYLDWNDSGNIPIGTIHKVFMSTDNGDVALELRDYFGTSYTVTFSNAGDQAEIVWDGYTWQVISHYNMTTASTATPVVA